MKIFLLVLLLLLNLVGIGCKSLTRATIQASQSAFLTQFSLQKTFAITATPGLDCSKFGVGGGIGSSAGGLGSGGVTHSQSFTVSCEISGSEPFKESQVFLSLKSEIKRQIQATGMQLKGSAYSTNDGFQIEYAEGKIRGKVQISGQRNERYYSVTARIDESSK